MFVEIGRPLGVRTLFRDGESLVGVHGSGVVTTFDDSVIKICINTKKKNGKIAV
jgi:hypothetical protein